MEADEPAQLAWRVGGVVAEGTHDVWSGVQLEEDGTAVETGQLVQLVPKRGDDPEVPPPPHRAQDRSSFSSALAVTRRPSAVTTSAEIRSSQVRPYLRLRYAPIPPPKVNPPIPVVELNPAGVASPYV